MQILVTGAFGFLGGRIAQSLSNSGNTVVLGSGRELNPPEWLPDVITVQMEWEKQASLKKIFEGINVIIHCAGVNAQDSQLNPVNALKYNGLYTSSLVEAAKEAKAKARGSASRNFEDVQCEADFGTILGGQYVWWMTAR